MRPDERFWTVSNMVSILRLVLTVPLVWYLWNGQREMAIVVTLIAAASDWADGRLARATGTVSEWGKILDPVADKVLIGAVVIVMTIQHMLPMWFVVAVVVRDVVILLGGIYAQRKANTILPSLFVGKLAVSAIALSGAFGIMQWNLALQISIGVSCVLMTLSLWQYTERLHGILRQTQTKTR